MLRTAGCHVMCLWVKKYFRVLLKVIREKFLELIPKVCAWKRSESFARRGAKQCNRSIATQFCWIISRSAAMLSFDYLTPLAFYPYSRNDISRSNHNCVCTNRQRCHDRYYSFATTIQIPSTLDCVVNNRKPFWTVCSELHVFTCKVLTFAT